MKETRVPEIPQEVICQRQYNQLSLLGHYYSIAISPSYSLNEHYCLIHTSLNMYLIPLLVMRKNVADQRKTSYSFPF